MKGRPYTAEQGWFIRVQYKLLSIPALTRAFNERFGETRTEGSIRAYTRNHRIRSGRTGRFEKGQESWNTGLAGKGICKPNSGTFTNGSIPANTRPLYSERVGKDGYIEIKVPVPNPYTTAKTRYMHKHRWLWEQKNGPAPAGHAVIFKDGDRRNFDHSNLVLISRRKLSLLNINGYFSAPPEHKEIIWNTVMLENAVINNELKDGTKSHRQLIIEALQTGPKTSAQIAQATGIDKRAVSSHITKLKKLGSVIDFGQDTNSHRNARVWKWKEAQ